MVPIPFLLVSVTEDNTTKKPEAEIGIPVAVGSGIQKWLRNHPDEDRQPAARALGNLGKAMGNMRRNRSRGWSEGVFDDQTSALDVDHMITVCDKSLGQPMVVSCEHAAWEFKPMDSLKLDPKDDPFTKIAGNYAFAITVQHVLYVAWTILKSLVDFLLEECMTGLFAQLSSGRSTSNP